MSPNDCVKKRQKDLLRRLIHRIDLRRAHRSEATPAPTATESAFAGLCTDHHPYWTASEGWVTPGVRRIGETRTYDAECLALTTM